ncbi:protein FAM186B isoform X3 [Mastomys coucha]|nr:protein FAM186B isoform X3 [Mastomys coucha]
MASFSTDAKAKEKHLYEILHWLGEWGDSLTYEIKNRRSAEEDEALDEWIEVMEKVLPLSLMATKGGIESLISLCSTLIEDQKKRTQMSKHNFWQDWNEESPQKEGKGLPEAPSPEQMLQDKNTTHLNVSEVRSMLQELLDSTMFSKGEVKAIRYMSAVVENLNKALILQHKENKNLETKYKHLQEEKNRELSTQRLHFQKSIRVLESKRDALLKQVKVLGDKYHSLIVIKHALEFQLKVAEASNGLQEPAKGIVEDLEPFERGEEDKQEPKEERSRRKAAVSLSPLTEAWDSGTTPAAPKPLSGTATDSRVKDVFVDRTELLEPVILHSEVPQIPTQWEKLVDKQGKDEGDHIQEEGAQSKSYPEKSLSPGSTRRMLLESHMGHWEEELNWETRRQQWLREEEMWLQRQKKWALLEQEHQEKVRQWEAEAAAIQQWQRLTQPGEEKQSPRKEQKASSEKMIFTTTSRWKNLEKPETPPPTPHCRAQSARQSRSYLLTSPHTQQPGQGIQRTLCSAEFMQMPRTQQVSAKSKKSTSFPITGTPIRRVTWTSLQKAPGTPKDKVYYIDMEAQLKNLQILGGSESELALPQYLRSKALEISAFAMELSTLRLQYLCKKYIQYRHYQSLRQEVIKHIGAIRQTRVTYKAQNFYVFLENIDRQQSLGLQAWTDKQRDLEEKRQEYLYSMVTMFPKLQKEWNIHLNIPVLSSVKPVKSKSSPVLLQRVCSSRSTTKQPPPPKHRESVPLRITGQQGSQMEAIWKADVASSSHPIEKKTPTNTPWERLGGYPDIPRLLAADEHLSYPRSSAAFKARSFSASSGQRKECQEPLE